MHVVDWPVPAAGSGGALPPALLRCFVVARQQLLLPLAARLPLPPPSACKEWIA